MSVSRQRVEELGELQEQYSVYSSSEWGNVRTRCEPFAYGLAETRYKVRHFGHCTQWRIRTDIPQAMREHTTKVVPQLDINGLRSDWLHKFGPKTSNSFACISYHVGH
jgi:hypothetical protein